MAHAPPSRNRFAVFVPWILATVALAALAVAGFSYKSWLPPVQGWVANLRSSGGESVPAAKGEEAIHAGHDHGHSGHAEESSIELSQQARKNIGLRLKQVRLETFARNVTVPGIVVERPGLSVQEVTAPLTGVVTQIYAIQGEAVGSGQKLFEIRLAHEEVVQAQANMLRTVEELAVNQREIERLRKVTADGGVPGKMLLEREYEKQKQLAVLRAQRATLLLHGLTQEQVATIEKDRTLLPKLTVYGPETSAIVSEFQLEDLQVSRGQHVNAGDALAILTDHSQLYIEGNAFERDAKEVSEAAAKGLTLSGYVEVDGALSEPVSDLRILYIANQVDRETRTLHFYAELPNEKLRERETKDGKRFIAWRFRTGQRMQLQVPVETWKDQIVLPVSAVAQEAAEAYVFAANGDHFDRRPVHVLHRDPLQVVIANDGSIFPGDTVAISGAQQLQLALKNKAGGGIDPHAGHNH